MPETGPAINPDYQKETQTAPKEGYAGFLARKFSEFLGKPEFEGLKKWFTERVAALPEMKVASAPLTGKGGWNKEMTESGEVDKITSGFFNLEGRDVDSGRKKPDGSPMTWNQAGIIQAETPITIPTPEGEMKMKASGFVGIIRDTQGNVLLTVGQEPLLPESEDEQSKKKPVVRTPFQTSSTKFQGILEGKRELDPGLAEAIDAIGEGKTPYEMFQSGEMEIFPLAPADANRIQATNIGFSAVVKGDAVKEKLSADGKNRWCTPDEVRALIKAGLINGHTAAALAAVIL